MLIDSLDFYSRIRMGQFSEITAIFPYGSITRSPDVDSLISALKCEMIPELKDGGYFSIHDSRVGNGQIAHDIQQVVTHAISWKRHPTGGLQVIFDDPYQCSEEPLPTIRIEES